MYLACITVYPIKSLDGQAVESAMLVPGAGLLHDRSFALVDGAGRFVNGKRDGRIGTIRSFVDLAGRVVTLEAPGTGRRAFRLDEDRDRIEAFLSDLLALSVRLVENAETGFPDDTQASGPTVVSTASLEAVADWFGLSLDSVRRRFRANLEIAGVEPFWEDRLYSADGEPVPFRIGAARFDGINPCQRCVVPSRDPQTGAVTDRFAQGFAEHRAAALPAWAPRARFDHFYRFCVNTRSAVEVPCALRLGDEVKRCGKC